MAARYAPQAADNPFAKTGLTPDIVQTTANAAGADGLRGLVGAVHRQTAKILHPDTITGSTHDAGAAFLDEQTQALNMLRSYDDPAVLTLAKAYHLRAGKGRNTPKTGMELVDTTYIRTGQLIHDLVAMTLETEVSMPSAMGKHIWLQPSLPDDSYTVRRLDSDTASFRTAQRESLTAEVDDQRLKSTDKAAAQKAIMERKSRLLNVFLAAHPDPRKSTPGMKSWLRNALGEKNLTNRYVPELLMAIGDSALQLAAYSGGEFLYETELSRDDELRQEFPDGTYTLRRGSYAKGAKGEPLRFSLSESCIRLDETPATPLKSAVIGSVASDFVDHEKNMYRRNGTPLTSLPASTSMRNIAIPTVPVPESRFRMLESYFTPLLTTDNHLVGVSPRGEVGLLGKIIGIQKDLR